MKSEPPNSIILEIQGSANTELDVSLSQPTKIHLRKTLGELAESSDVILLHRIVFNENYQTEFEFNDHHVTETSNWYFSMVQLHLGRLRNCRECSIPKALL